MSGNELVKRNTSGLQVLKTLQVLLEDNYTMSELITKLNEKEKDSIFNNSVISKYINTCRECDIEIQKIQNRYYVTKLPFGLDLSSQDIKLLEELKSFSNKNFLQKTKKNFEKFMTKLNQFSNKHIIKISKESEKEFCEFFEKAIQNNKVVLLKLKNNTTATGFPVEIVLQKEKKCFKIKRNKKSYIIPFDKISGMEMLENKILEAEQEVIFKLFGGLAHRYTLREHESLHSSNLPYNITISNKGEEKEVLLARLLRYDSKCEIVSPQNYRDDFRKMLDEMLANYGE